MRILYASLLVVGLFNSANAVPDQSGTGAAVSAPAARAETLVIVDRLTAAREPVADEGKIKDPFYPSASDLTGVVEKQGAAAGGLSDQALLELIAAQINPTGSVELGGEPQLLFTEKRQKIGDKLTVSLDKIEYVVEIVSIDKNRFRIRYNNVETTRAIK